MPPQADRGRHSRDRIQTAASATRLNTERVATLLVLLDDTDFCRDAVQVIDRLWQRWEPSALPSRADFDAVLPSFVEEHVAPFIHKWGALPPPFRELVAPDSTLKTFDMMVSGRFGLIPVLPWTSQPHVLAAHRRILRLIGRQHSDRQNVRRVQTTMWLSDHELPIDDIIRALWSAQTWPRWRRTPRTVSFEEEQRLMTLAMRQGLDYRTAESRFRRRIRTAKESKAATVRMALSRYIKERTALNNRIRDFGEIDTVSFGLAGVLRSTLETGDIHRVRDLAVAARDAFVKHAGR